MQHKNPSLKYAFFVSIFCLAPNSMALDHDRLMPYYVESQSMLFNRASHQVIYQGQVKIIQGSTILSADWVKVFLAKKDSNSPQMTKLIARGRPATYSTLMDKKPGRLLAKAQYIIYNPQTKNIQLLGNALIKEENNRFQGPQIWYDMQRAIVRTTAANTQSKTIIVIQPQTQ